MSTQIELDEDLVRRAIEGSGAETVRATVEEALRSLLRLHAQKGARQLRGTVAWEGDLNPLRERRLFEANTNEP